MTIFEHTNEHSLDCDCLLCMDVDPNKSIARELERYVEELTLFSLSNLTEQQQIEIHKISTKFLLMRRYFPIKELPVKHARLLASLE